ncbi:hypothetical protein QAD02_019499 [Eretmocerus hayati]|uniref:Uncharacterized protein n=1 Tax=Eretmocerus hayati TaxID=131215 RepID=A0ACC2PK15_9HYME|nr:hypothetical protein QAD02_019499 [Eretmocerus hayati]
MEPTIGVTRGVAGSQQSVLHYIENFSVRLEVIKVKQKAVNLPHIITQMILNNHKFTIRICPADSRIWKNHFHLSLCLQEPTRSMMESEISVMLNGVKEFSATAYINTAQYGTCRIASVVVDYQDLPDNVLRLSKDQLTLLCEVCDLQISESSAN